MIKFIKLCTILLLGVSFKTFAVDPAFIVFYNSGKAIKLIEGKSVALKKGDHLQSDDQISIPEKTQLVLVCANFSVVQLKNKTKFTVKSLVSKCDKLVTSASSAYFKYMWNSFAHEHVAPEKNPRSFMKTYGAASRSSNVVPKVSLDTIIYYNEPLNIGWLPAKSIQIIIYDKVVEGKIVATIGEAKSANINLMATQLKRTGTYYLDMVGEKNVNRKVLKIYTKAKYQIEVAKILNNVAMTSPAEKAYLTGFMLEESRFLVEALKYYQRAKQLQPNNSIYIATVNRFIP